MRFSNFTVITELEKNFILYNSRYSSIVMLDAIEMKALKEDIKNNTNISGLIDELKLQKIIVDDYEVESEELLQTANKLRYEPTQITFTIAPSMNCNFDCFYCYEKGFRQHTMSDEIAHKVAQFVLDNVSPNQTLKVIWYGGEPLMGFHAIEIISEAILAAPDRYHRFIAEIVTNGYLLTNTIVKKLVEYHVEFAQITLDGSREIHDSRRYLHNHKPSFDTILNNIRSAISKLKISIRINIDNINNSTSVLELMDILNEFNLLNKVGFYLAPVEDFKDSNNPACLSSKEYSFEEIKIYKTLFNKGINIINIPRPTLGFCEAINEKDYVIDPNGFLYKCWALIGHKHGQVGNIFDGIDFNEMHDIFTKFKLLKDEQHVNFSHYV